MADRSVVVRLLADVGGFVAGLGRANEQTRQFTRGLAASARENGDAWEQVGGVLTAVGAAAGGALVGIAVKAASFEKQMSAAKVATGATAGELDALTEAAKKAGAETVFSADEAAQGITELAKAGISTADILGGGLSGALSLAAAGQLEVADAAEITSTAMRQFGLSGDRASSVADALAAGANEAVGDVDELSQALSQGGGAAAGLGVSIEQTIGTLAAFASQSLRGSDAGTSLKTLLSSLAAPTAEASGLMAELGIEVFDAQGNFIGLNGVAGELQSSLGGLTQQQREAALATIFGSDASRAARILYSQGAESIDRWTEAVSQQGYASEQSAAILDNLAGDVEALGGSLETLAVNLGDSTLSPLRQATQDLTTLVNLLGSAPEPAQQAVVGALGVTAAVGLAGGAALIAVPQVVSLYDSLGRLGRAGAGAQGALRGLATLVANPWALAFAAGAAILGGAFLKAHLDAQQQADDLAATLDKESAAVTDLTSELVAQELQSKGLLSAARDLGVSIDTVTRAALGEKDALQEVEQARDAAAKAQTRHLRETGSASRELQGANTAYNLIKDNIGTYGAALERARKQVRDTAEATKSVSGALGIATGAAEATAGAVDEVTTSAEDAADSIEALSDRLDRLFGAAFSVQVATDNLQERLNGLGDAAEDNGHDLDGLSDSAIANRRQFQGLVQDAFDVINAMAENGAQADELSAATENLKGQIAAAGAEAGYSAEDVAYYTAKLDGVPEAVSTTVGATVTGLGPVSTLTAYIASLKDKTIVLTAKARYLGFKDLQNSAPGFAAGGLVGGSGPRGVDSQVIVAAPGEFVVSTTGVDAVGVDALEAINRGQVAPAAASLASSTSAVAASAPQVRVFVGDTELRDIVGVEVDGRFRAAASAVRLGRRG